MTLNDANKLKTNGLNLQRQENELKDKTTEYLDLNRHWFTFTNDSSSSLSLNASTWDTNFLKWVNSELNHSQGNLFQQAKLNPYIQKRSLY